MDLLSFGKLVSLLKAWGLMLARWWVMGVKVGALCRVHLALLSCVRLARRRRRGQESEGDL